ncbi:MAG TPA: M14 family zinc carboxypeptidase [Planctomycetota bacterium]
MIAPALLALLLASVRQEVPPSPAPAPDGGEAQGESERKQEGGDAPPVEVPPQEVPRPAPSDVPADLPPAAGEAAPPPPQAENPAPSASTLPPAHPPVTWPLSSEALAAHLRGIAEAHPTIALLETLDRSAQGREILVLRLGLRDGGEAARPTLLLADHHGRASAGPEAMVALAWRLASAHEQDEGVRALLARASLVLAPALDPDARSESVATLQLGASSVEPVAAAPAARAPLARFERNFPSGWQPETRRAGSGRVSLSMPETLAATRFLAGLDACSVVLGFAPTSPPGQPYAGAELPAGDREVFQRLAAALERPGARALIPWYEHGSPGGGFFDFAYQARGIYPLFFALPSEEELTRTGAAPFVAEVGERVLGCLALLPRVELAQEAFERVAPDTWQLDLRLVNAGLVPTASALVGHRGVRADVVLALAGAKLLATAHRARSGTEYTPVFEVRTPLSAGTLAGGEERWLRLLIEAGPGAAVSVTASSPWAGRAQLRLTLP